MAQSLAKILVHIIFSTKDRFPFLAKAEIRRRMHAYVAEVFNVYQSPAIEVGEGAQGGVLTSQTWPSCFFTGEPATALCSQNVKAME